MKAAQGSLGGFLMGVGPLGLSWCVKGVERP